MNVCVCVYIKTNTYLCVAPCILFMLKFNKQKIGIISHRNFESVIL